MHAARIDPAGFLVLSRARLRDAEPEIARRAMEQALGAIGARPYGPRAARLQRLLEALRADQPWRGRTLAGCRITARGDWILICREPGSIREVLPLRPGGGVLRWDDRFAVAYRGGEPDLVLRALGQDGLSQRRRLRPLGAAREVPAPVRPSLPAVWRGDELLFAPHLALVEPAFAGHVDVRVSYRPRRPLAGPGFAGFAAVAAPEPGLLGPVDSLC